MGGSELRLLTPDPGNPLDPGMNSKPTIPFGAVLQKLPPGLPGHPIFKDILERSHKGSPGHSEGASRVPQGTPRRLRGSLKGAPRLQKEPKSVLWRAQRRLQGCSKAPKRAKVNTLEGQIGPEWSKANPWHPKGISKETYIH